MNVLLRTDDLMSRVRLSSRWAKSGHEITIAPGATIPDMIVVDLSNRQALDRLRQDRTAFPTTTIVAFGPHVDGETLKNARVAGADHAIARGSVLEQVLQMLDNRDKSQSSTR